MTLLLPCDAFELFVFPPTWQEEGQAECVGTAIDVVRHEPPMQMDGPCALYTAQDRIYIEKMRSFFYWILKKFDSSNVC